MLLCLKEGRKPRRHRLLCSLTFGGLPDRARHEMPWLVFRWPRCECLAEGVDAGLICLQDLPVRRVHGDLCIPQFLGGEPQLLAEVNDPWDEATKEDCTDGPQVLQCVRGHVQCPRHPYWIARRRESTCGDLAIYVRAEFQSNAQEATGLCHVQGVGVPHRRGEDQVAAMLGHCGVDAPAHVHPCVAKPSTISVDLVRSCLACQVRL
mmetsp:Transcript_99096/g.289110  ORF Transcript_99096/g.289110 Transcript_99096/m.289110 type:complete len:207 (-) Transcript_99096:711-1331(-)